MTYRERLLEVAEEHYGYVTSSDAQRLGIPVVELGKLAYRGKLTSIRRGVYRFPNTRITSYDVFYSALMYVGEEAFLIKDAVLSMHNLAFVNPNRIRVGTIKRLQHKVPDWIRVERYETEEVNIQIRENIRMTSVAQAIVDSRNIVMNERLEDALKEAKQTGLVFGDEYKKARKALKMPYESWQKEHKI